MASSRITPQDMVAKWRQSTLKERSSYQEHFIDVCRLLGHATPAEIDPHGKFFTFEAGANKLTGEQGWADVWYKGHFAWEYKGKHADLEKAYKQLLQYREALENPPLLIVSDIDQIDIHTNFTNTIKRIYHIQLEDLLVPEKFAWLRDAFYSPEGLRAPHTTEQVTQQAAARFARIAESLRASGEEPHRIAHFLIRLLFCLFSEDVGLLPGDLFTKLVERSRTQPEAFAAQLRQLFAAMSSGGWFGPEEILHFDGRLFDDDNVLDLDRSALESLGQITNLDWSSIEPSIFGTLFERSLDPGKRAQLGAHYTSKDDILLIVEPVLMTPFRRRWEEVESQARELAEKRDRSKGANRKKLSGQLASLLQGFAGELSDVHVLDPACGSGNFLYVVLRQLLDLQKEVITLAGELGVGRFFPSVSPAQLHGIEINEYAHQLAQATIWIGYIQWLSENGFGVPSQPILKPLDNILLMDAILAYDEAGQPVEPVWPEADVIIGNPPFLGSQKFRRQLGAEYSKDLFNLYHGRVPGAADLVCYWFEYARNLVAKNTVNRVGLLATQAIRAGRSRSVLDNIKNTGDIFFAWSDRPWILEGADVRVSIIGFDDGSEHVRKLDDVPVENIVSNLTTSVDISSAIRLSENSGIGYEGIKKHGPFEITLEIAESFLSDEGNPNSLPNSDVIKPWIIGLDITDGSRNMWIIDFKEDMPIELASQYEKPFEFVKTHVKPYRDRSNEPQLKEKWWVFGRPRPALRISISKLDRFIVTPRVAKHRLFVWVDKNTVPDGRLNVFARNDDYFLGVLHSRIHEVWALANSAHHGIGGDPTYNNRICFETFPFPWPPGYEPQEDPRVQAIAYAARELVEKREAWLNPSSASEPELKKRTLTNLYNQRPTWLDMAHRKLDQAVFAAYGWPADLNDEEILEKLLELNLVRAGKYINNQRGKK